MTTRLQPLKDRLVLRRMAVDNLSKGGIHIPDSAQQKSEYAKVVAVGAEADSVQVGNTVLIGKFAGTEVRVDHVDYVILQEKDVLAILL